MKIIFLAIFGFSSCLFDFSSKGDKSHDTTAAKEILSLNKISADISDLSEYEKGRIVSLNLSDLSLDTLIFPASIAKLDGLKKLNLSNNNLKDISEEIEELSGIKTLDLSNNQFSNFPKGVLKLQKITSLDLSNNDIENVPGEFLEKSYIYKFEFCNGPCGEENCCNWYESNGLNINGNKICGPNEESIEWLNSHYIKGGSNWQETQKCQ